MSVCTTYFAYSKIYSEYSFDRDGVDYITGLFIDYKTGLFLHYITGLFIDYIAGLFLDYTVRHKLLRT
jgi:hypothetical protein